MYSNGSSHFSKQKMQAQRKMHYHSKGKSCGYYMRIIFFFSSLIQSLIIVSLVLFLVYGKPQDSASTARIEDLEKSFSRLSIENVALRHQRKNLTNLLNVTLIEKARNDWDLARLRYFTNISATMIQDLDRKVQQCQTDMIMCRSRSVLSGQCPPMQPGHCQCDMFVEQLRARLDLVASNFTQTTQVMKRELDQTAKERDNLHLAVIGLRRDKFMHEKEVELYKQRCKEDFVDSLSGVSNVTKAFLQKVDSLFPTHIAFQLTCAKQREHLEQIRTNCTSLSREVEDKFQRYLNNVGTQVSGIQGENSRLKAENWRLTGDYRTCSQNRTGMVQQHKQNVDKLQQKHDTEKEALLIDKMKLNGEIEVLNNNVRYKNMEVEHIKEQLRQLNMSCMAKMGMGGFPPRQSPNMFNPYAGGSSSSSSSSTGGGQTSRTGSGSTYGSYGSTANKPVSSVLNSPSSSVMSTGYGSSSGVGVNRQSSTGTGSSSSTGYGSSSSYGANRQSSTGSGSSSSSSSTGYGSSSGVGVNKQGSTGSGSSSSSTGYGSSSSYGANRQSSTGSGSSSSSTGYGSSSGVGVNKQGSTGSGSSSSSSSTGYGSSSTYGVNKQGSTGSGSSSSTGYGSSSGVGVNKQGSTGSGSSSSSTGYGSSSSYGATRQSSTGSGSSSSSSSTGYGSSSGAGVSKQGSTGSGSSSSSAGSAVSGRGPSTAGSSIGSAGASQNVGSSAKTTGSTGSASKSGSSSSGGGWWWGGSSNSGQSKTGSVATKGPSTGSSYSGSSSGGRTSGLGGGSVSVAQHLQDLQRLINPSGPEGRQDRQDLSRLMG